VIPLFVTTKALIAPDLAKQHVWQTTPQPQFKTGVCVTGNAYLCIQGWREDPLVQHLAHQLQGCLHHQLALILQPPNGCMWHSTAQHSTAQVMGYKTIQHHKTGWGAMLHCQAAQPRAQLAAGTQHAAIRNGESNLHNDDSLQRFAAH
jgi:hypothetical protein